MIKLFLSIYYSTMNNPSARIYDFRSPMSKGSLQLDNSLHVFLLSNLFIDVLGNRLYLFLCCCENITLSIFFSVADELGYKEKVSRYPLNGCYQESF